MASPEVYLHSESIFVVPVFLEVCSSYCERGKIGVLVTAQGKCYQLAMKYFLTFSRKTVASYKMYSVVWVWLARDVKSKHKNVCGCTGYGFTGPGFMWKTNQTSVQNTGQSLLSVLPLDGLYPMSLEQCSSGKDCL